MPSKFKLQPVLKHRGLLEDQARQRLAEALREERELLERFEQERRALETLQSDLCQQQMRGISIQDLLLYESHIDHRSRVLSHLGNKHEQLREKIADCRLALCQASQDKQLLEKLKAKKEAEFRQLQQQHETRQLDEIALQFGGAKS